MKLLSVALPSLGVVHRNSKLIGLIFLESIIWLWVYIISSVFIRGFLGIGKSADLIYILDLINFGPYPKLGNSVVLLSYVLWVVIDSVFNDSRRIKSKMGFCLYCIYPPIELFMISFCHMK